MSKLKYHFFNIFLFLLLTGLACLNLVHEFGHVLGAYLVNAEIKEIKFFPKAYIKVSDKTTKDQMKIIVPAGSLLNSMYAILLMILGRKKNTYGIFLAGLTILEAEMVYWNTFTPFAIGDAKMFYTLFPNIGKSNRILSGLLSIVQILLFGYSIKSIYDIFNSEDKLYISISKQEKKFEEIIKKTINKYQLY